MEQQPFGVLDSKKWDDGRPCVVVGGGPSLIPWRQKLWYLYQKYWVIAVNDSYQYTFFPDIITTLDHAWTQKQFEKDPKNGFKYFPGPVVAAVDAGNPRIPSENLTYLYRLRREETDNKAPFSEDPKKIVNGMNSGHCALQLAYLKGCKIIYLLGFDFKEIDQKTHFHKGYEWHNRVSSQHLYAKWAKAMEDTLPQLKNAGVQVFNCSDNSALVCFPYKPYAEVLGAP